MKWWVLVKQFPKYALVFGIIIGSTALFAFWWIYHSRAKAHSKYDNSAELAAIRAQAAKAEARIDYLFLADDDLYDAGTGELIFKNWLKGDHPKRLLYDAKAKRLYGQYDEGYALYAFDGTRKATMMMPLTPPASVPGSNKIVFAKDKNIWTAEIDWDAFKFVNERQVTTIGVFYEQHFAENVQLLTDKTLVVRNMHDLLRVNLDTGNVKPVRIPLADIDKWHSPDSKWVVGTENGQFYCYDVDADDAKTIPVGRTRMSEFQWHGNDRCICLAGDNSVASYNRLANSLAEVTALPFSCFKMGEPSPDGRYIFAAGGMDARNGLLVDLKEKSAARVNGGAGIAWVSDETFTFSRDVPDSDFRGMWLQKTNDNEKRVSPEPYLITNGGPLLLVLPSAKMLTLATRHGLVKMKLDGSEFTAMPGQAQIAAKLMRIVRLPVE